MSARVIRHMSLTKASVVVFVVVALLTTLLMIKMSQGQAAPNNPTDETKVPHYFGPYSNYLNSPLRRPMWPSQSTHQHRASPLKRRPS